MKLLFGIMSIGFALVAYYVYFRDMARGKTKPHAFSWLVWGLLAGIGFLTQVSAHAGFGAWATGITSLASLTIFSLTVRLGSSRPTRFDWVLLSLALVSLLLLVVVRNEAAALSLTIIALVAGFAMNIRKAYYKPSEENAAAFWLNTFKFIPAIFALAHFSFLTVAYPLVAAMGNASVALVVQIRGNHLARRRRPMPDSAEPLG